MKVNVPMRVLVLLLACCFLFFAGQAKAQGTDAAVSGQITDPDGRVVPGVTVVLTNLNTNVPYTTQTNNEGIYRFPAVQPGIYRANVTKDGFASIVKGDIELHVQDQVSINFALKVGSVSETMTIEAGAPMINTTDASVSTVVDQTYVKNMPLNGRSFQDLILLTPGVVTTTPQNNAFALNGYSGEFVVNGQRAEDNYYTVDGVSANVGFAGDLQGTGASGSLAASTALGTTQGLVSVDDLQEFRVQSSTYSAEYGRNPGGQIGFETKSGANQFHGTAYDYLRNNVFDANDWFTNYNNLKEPALRQNDFGGTLGGPVSVPGLYKGKDSTFFFVSYEGLRLRQPQEAALSFVPDDCLRGTSGATCPQGISPALSTIQPALNAFPVANGPETLMTVQCDPASDPSCSANGTKQVPSGLARFVGTWSNPASIDSTSVRLDQAIGSKLRLFFRFSDTASDLASRAVFFASPSSVSSTPYTLRTYTAGANSTFSTRLANDFRLNYSSNWSSSKETIDAFAGSTPIDLASVSGLAAGSSAVFKALYNGFFLILGQGGGSSVQRQWNLVDTVSFVSGRHQFKFGADYRRLTPVRTPPPSAVDYIFQSESDIQNNTQTGGSGTQRDTNAPAYPLYQNFSAFAQDEWKATQRLSISMGLRWELNPAPGVTQGLNARNVVGSSPDTWTLTPPGTPLWRTTWYNFGPRLGAAYILRNTTGREMVVRVGGGVFFDTGQQLGSGGFANGVGFFSSTFSQGSFPNPPAAQAISSDPPWSNVWGIYPHLQLPYTLQWNASVEQALGASRSLTVSYVGSHAARLLQETNVFPNANQNIGFAVFVQNGLTSDYDSAQAQFQQRLTRGLTALASYTWSHCLDYGSLNYFFGYQRGNCDFDMRHNLASAFSYDVPNVGQGRLMGAILHHWGLDNRFTARTGFPVTLNSGGNLDPNGNLYDNGVNINPGVPFYLYGADCTNQLQNLGELLPGQGCPGGRAINPNAFSFPNQCAFGAPVCYGNAPRNFLRGFGAWQMDVALRREFPIHERLGLQFRAEAFNVFNHPNFGQIESLFGAPNFGMPVATLANSLGILSPQYQMGGPRSMQFALKLLF